MSKTSIFKNMMFKDKVIADEMATEIQCPYCGAVQVVSESAVSAMCKRCRRIYDVKTVLDQADNQDDFEPSYPSNSNHSTTTAEKHYYSDSKPITCSSCRTKQDVPTVAISAFCKKCGQRINLQDYKKSDFFRGDLETKGTLYITSTGNVQGNVSVGEAIIDGRFNGKMVADGLVKIQPGAIFQGELFAPKIEVAEGASFVGSSVVKPDLR